MKDELRKEVLALRHRYDDEPTHSDHVARLSLLLLDGLKKLDEVSALKKSGPALLEAAALLHDIGWSQTPDGRGHHKHSARLILEARWRHLAPAEIPVVAQVARYHRKAVPQPHHTRFHELPPAAQKQVSLLGGILRIADGLDRTHTQRIESLSVVIRPKKLLVQVKPLGPWEAERAMFDLKRDLLQDVLRRRIECSGEISAKPQ